jgi:hypothetical protein
MPSVLQSKGTIAVMREIERDCFPMTSQMDHVTHVRTQKARCAKNRGGTGPHVGDDVHEERVSFI